MTIAFLLIFGAIGLFLIFSNWDFIMSGVAVGNSSATAGNYSGFNESVNAVPWLIPIMFIFFIAIAWWYSKRRGG